MFSLLLAILATFASIIVTGAVFLANSMSDAPSASFQGGIFIFGAWLITAVLWAVWYWK